MNLLGYLESALWASTCTSLLVFSVQIFSEKTNRIVLQTSVTAAGENWEWQNSKVTAKDFSLTMGF